MLWFVSSTAIKDQTLDALADRRHAYRRRLDAAFGGHVRVFDIEAFDMLTPADLAQNACVIVSTIQAFRVGNTAGRRVYAHHEALEPFFSALPVAGMERVSAQEATESPLLTEGAVKFSLANLLYHHRPLMLVDEAHNAVTGLSRDVQARVHPPPAVSPHGTIRFDAATYRDVALTPLNRLRFQKHLLGNDAVPAFDGDETGEEFACAQTLDALEEVEVWLRNIPRHRDSFLLLLLKDRFYPDFVAKLADGRLFVVEYKGADRATNEDTRNKTQIGACWARASGHVYATIEKVRHGAGMAEQMRSAIQADT